MRLTRIAIGLTTWLAALTTAGWWIQGHLLDPQGDGHRVVADVWQFASAERRIVTLQFDAYWPVEVGDPIYRVDGPGVIQQVGEIRRVLEPVGSTSTGARAGPRAVALLYPNAPRLCIESQLTCYMTPTSLTWVLETILPPARRVEIAHEIAAAYSAYRGEIVETLRPVLVGGLIDATQIVEEDLATALPRRRAQLERLGSRYQANLVDQELVPLIRSQIWPIVKKHVEPLAAEIGEQMFQRASVWRFGWRLVYDKLPLTDSHLVRAEWKRFVNEEAIPVLNSHASDFVTTQRLILEEIASNELVRDALHRNLSRVIDDPEFRAIVWDLFREVIIDNARLREKLEERWNSEEARRAVQLAADYAEPSVRRIGDMLFGTREAGIAPEFAQVLRNQILDKDCRWLVLETPAAAHPLDPADRNAVLRVRIGGYPPVNPFAVQLQEDRP